MITRVRREDVSFRDVKIKIPDRSWGCEWRHAPEACAEDLGGFEKSQLSWVLWSEEEGSQWPCGGCHTCWGCRWKSQHRKIVLLSPYVEEPLNLKVIKSFIPELRSRYVFFVFRDSSVLCIYVMNILCTFHISVSWVWYIKRKYQKQREWDFLFSKSTYSLLATLRKGSQKDKLRVWIEFKKKNKQISLDTITHLLTLD